ncbi:TetR/AcrR family transcriptional regulator [Novosphingopyxis sp.]|uniref:TetR/AcrR family transcriptional regulator n=1 Tax=Novosphingopyxis sp. TaxID=2709690 RepID=UPI003B5A0E79
MNKSADELTDSFFKLGYDRCTIDQMLQATGTSKSSLYNRFGSKRGAFQQALEHYRMHILQPTIFRGGVTTCGLGQIDGMYQAAIHLFSGGTPKGCLLLSRVGHSSHPEAVEAITIGKVVLAEELASHLRTLGFVEGYGSAARLMVIHFAALANWADDGVDRRILKEHAAMFARTVSAILVLQTPQKPFFDYDFMVSRLSERSKAIARATPHNGQFGWRVEAFLQRLYEQDCKGLR